MVEVAEPLFVKNSFVEHCYKLILQPWSVTSAEIDEGCKLIINFFSKKNALPELHHHVLHATDPLL